MGGPARQAAENEWFLDVHGSVSHDRLADGLDLEADLLQRRAVEDEAAVKDEGGLVHLLVDRVVVERLELVPLGADDQRVRASDRLQRRRRKVHELVDWAQPTPNRTTFCFFPAVRFVRATLVGRGRRAYHAQGHVGSGRAR